MKNYFRRRSTDHDTLSAILAWAALLPWLGVSAYLPLSLAKEGVRAGMSGGMMVNLWELLLAGAGGASILLLVFARVAAGRWHLTGIGRVVLLVIMVAAQDIALRWSIVNLEACGEAVCTSIESAGDGTQ